MDRDELLVVSSSFAVRVRPVHIDRQNFCCARSGDHASCAVTTRRGVAPMPEVGGISHAPRHVVVSDGVEMQAEAAMTPTNAASAHPAPSLSSDDLPCSSDAAQDGGEQRDENRPCCFICEEGGELIRVCQCTDRWIHLHC